MILKILNLYKNYNIVTHLDIYQKGVFSYILFLIKIIKTVVTHPIYIWLKYIFHILLIFEGILIVIFYTDFSIPYDIFTFDKFKEFLLKLNKNILVYIRDKINDIIGEQTIEPKNNSEVISINKEDLNFSSNTNTNYTIWLGIIVVVIISGIAVYYYYPDISNHFSNFNDIYDNDSDLLHSPISNSPTESDYFKDLSELTPKPSSSKLPES